MFKKTFLLTSSALMAAALLGQRAHAQTPTGWTGGVDALWSTAGNWDSGVPGGNTRSLFFGNGYVTAGGLGSLTANNDILNYAGHRITFEDTSLPVDPLFTITGNAFTLFDFGGNAPVIQNDSTSLQTINLTGTLTFDGLNGGGFAEINANAGDLTISNAVALANATQLRFNANASRTVTMSGPISGAGASVTKVGAGTVTFSGASANTFTGTLEVSAGTVNFSKTAGSNAFGGDLLVSGTGTTLQTQNNQIPDTATVTVMGGNFSLGDRDDTFANLTVLGGAANNTAAGGNSGAVTLTGALTVNGGGLSINSGGVWNVNSAALTTNVALNTNSTTRQTVLTIGAGGLTLHGATVTFNSGTAVGALGAKIVLAGDVVTNAAATPAIINNGGTGNVGPRFLDIGTGTRTFTVADGAAANDLQIDTQVGGTAVLTKTGNGVMHLSSTTNNFTGAIVVNGGTLSYVGQGNADPTVLGAGAKSITLNNNAALRPTTSSDPNAAGNKSVVIGATGGTIDTPAGVTLTLNDANQFQGTGLLTKTGPGFLTLGQASTGYAARTGNTVINDGAIFVGNANGLGAAAGTVTVNAGGAIGSNTGATIANAVTIAESGTAAFGQIVAQGANTLFGGTLTIPAGITAQMNVADYASAAASTTGRIIFTSGFFTGSGDLNISGPGTTGTGRGVFTINNTGTDYSGRITVNKAVSLENLARFSGVNATSPVTSGKTLGNATIVFGAGGTNTTAGLTPQLDLRDNGNGTAGQTFNYGNNLEAMANGGNIALGNGNFTGAGALNGKFQLGTLALGAQTLTVTGNQNYSVEFTGTTALVGDATISPTSTGAGSTNDVTLSGVVDGAFSLSKAGSGILTLGNAGNNFGGAGKTVGISAGTLAISSDGALGDTANTVTLTGGSLRATANFSSARGIVVNGTPVSITSNATLEANAGATLTLSTALSSASAAAATIGKIGAGTVASTVTTGAPFGSGNVNISAGQLALLPSGSGANVSLTGATSGEVSRLAVTGGTGYTAAPTVSFTSPTTGVTTTANTGLNGTAITATLTNNGGGYTAVPTVTLNGGTGGSGAVVAVAAMNQFGYDRNSSLRLDKGANNSLTYTVGVDFALTNSTLTRIAAGSTMTIIPSALANLGNTTAAGGERFIVNGGVIVTDGTVSPSIVATNSVADTTATFLTYDATDGFKPAAYLASTDIDAGVGASNFDATVNTSMTASRTVNAIRVGNGVSVGGAAGTVLSLDALANPSFVGTQSGIILNGGSITAPTITPGGEVQIYASAAGGAISSNFTGTVATAKFGPGTLVFSGGALPTGTLFLNDGSFQTGANYGINGQAVQLNSSTATLDLHGFNQTVGNLTVSVPAGIFPVVTTNSAPATLIFNSGTTFAGKLADGTGGGVLSVIKNSGAAILSTPNSYSGGTTIAGGSITVNATGTLGTGNVLVTGSSTLNISNAAAINNADGATLTLTAVDGAVPVLIMPANFKQPLTASSNGVIGIATGYTVTDALSGNSAFLGANTAQSYTAGSLVVGAGNTYRLGGGGSTLTVTGAVVTGANSLLVGVPAGNGGAVVNGTGTVILTAANTFSGTTTVSMGSTLSLAGTTTAAGGTAVNSTGFSVTGGTLLLNNDPGTNIALGNSNNRIADTAPVSLSQSTFQLQGPNVTAAGTNVTEQIGQLTYRRGSTVRVNIQGGASLAILRANSLSTRNVGDTLSITTQAAGQLTGLASSVSQFLINGTAPVVSATGGSGTGIVSPAIVNATDATYVTHGALGFANTTYSSASLATSTANDVVDATAGGALAAPATAYAARLGATALTGTAAEDLTLASGGLILNNGATAVTHTADLVFGSAASRGEAVLFVNNTGAASSTPATQAVITGAISASAITKFGSGSVRFSNAGTSTNANLANVLVTVNAGGLEFGNRATTADAQGLPSTAVVVMNGGAINFFQTQTLAGLSGTAGTVRVGANTSANTAKTLTVNNATENIFSGTFTSDDDNAADSSFTKGGTGKFTFNGAFQSGRTIQVNYGEVVFANNVTMGTANGDRQRIIIGQGGAFTLNNTGINNVDRITLNSGTTNGGGYLQVSGGTFNFLGSSFAPSSETFGTATALAANNDPFFGPGADTINIVAGNGQPALLVSERTIVRNTGASVVIRGTNLGGTRGAANVATFAYNTSSPTLAGFNAGAGTGAQTGVIKGVIANSVVGGVDTFGIATYDKGQNLAVGGGDDIGVRALNASEVASTIVDGDTTTLNNVKLTGGAASTIAGAAAVNALHLGGGAVAGAGTLTIDSGMILAANNGAAGGNLISTDGLVFSGGEAIIHTASDLVVSSPLTGTLAITKGGNASLILTNSANSFAGNVLVNGGLISVDDNAKLGAAANAVTLNNGGGLQLTANTLLETGGTKRNVALGAAGGRFDVTSGNVATLSGVVSGGLGVITGGVSGSTGATTSTTVFTKTGVGTLVLTGANTFTGAVDINAGALFVGDGVSGALGVNSPVNVNAGGTLGGSGTIGALATVNAGGTLAPGNSPGILNFAGGLAFNAGSSFAVELLGSFPGDIGGYDQANVTGTVSLFGTVNLTLNLGLIGGFSDNTTFTIINNDLADVIAGGGLFAYNGTPLSEGAAFTVPAAGGTQIFTISYAGGSGNDVVLTSVPEPGSAAMLLGGLGALAGLRRARRRR